MPPSLRRTLTRACLTTILIAGCSKTTNPDPSDDPSISDKPRVIYGEDNRHEYFEEADARVRTLSESTMALMKFAELKSNGDAYDLHGEVFAKANRLCPGEKYAEQITPAFCSGFLVAPNKIVTAGHCISSARDCSEVAFVFGYALRSSGAEPRQVPARDVYRCARVVHTQAPTNGADYAVVELDRPVLDRASLTLRQSGAITAGEEIFVAGHPSGLPLKIAGGASVRTIERPGYFVANLDTYGGNSGSAIFNSKSLEVEGIIVRGETDFRMKPEGCLISYVCEEKGCRGEDVTKISEVLPWL